ncbi:DUF7312 domain-containing protein [Haloarcula nitratireducens]|uniref:DUF7312 domain-containing protein n=1 Tax=Haloarcula nitratireducens TaxID=2487749 RepID=A0AAW4P6D8_9EURY|nr:hypothetical protein [Halomicroarcula nitratireducens]MBX0293409.1 hypothetical protein [Halomicroarcula nitratireducens]
MPADGRDDDPAAEESDDFVETYEYATEADVIRVEEDEPDDEEGAVAGSFSPAGDVEPGTPGAENTAFVALGVYIATLALGQMFVGSVVYAPTTLAAITATVAIGTVLCYGLFTRTDPDT